MSSDDIRSCATALGFGLQDDAPTVLTSDQRGDFTSLMVEQSGATGYCVLAGGIVENSVDFSAVVAPPVAAEDAAYDVVQVSDWMLAISGRAGADVTTLAVTNPETGQSISATLGDGVWAAWWPVASGSLGSGPSAMDAAKDLTIDFATADGRSHVSTGISDAEEGHADPDTSPPLFVLGALAGWSAAATPIPASAADVDSCAKAADSWAAGSSTVLVADTRGDYESLVIDHSGDRAYCVLKAGQIQWARELGALDAGIATASGTAVLEQLNGFDGIAGSRVEEVQGSVGDGVMSVTVHLAAGVDVPATVQNGQWMAWWPESELPTPGSQTPQPTHGSVATAQLPAGPPAFSWTTSDGVTHGSLQ
ncbi:hypothetical protein [Subtercola sp. YIM 133946]|uniref:hypothetical protein n=1 Tax=Subtercola sp. YIM 133946 TaxID=3118909 RepID=UPI002F91FE28